MSKLIVLTDLHMTPEGVSIIGLDPLRRLEAAVAHINRRHPDAERVIVAGDLTHRGDAASYARARGALARLAVPVSLMIGNHDDRTAFQAAFPEAARDEDGFVQEALTIGGYRLLLLDTVMDRGPAGALCPQRMAWLGRELDAAGDAPVAIVMHHPPHATGFAGMDAIALQNGEAFYAALEGRPNIRQIVAGHVHRTISGSHRGVPFCVFKSPVHQQPMDLDARDTSLSVDEPGAYGILLLGPHGVVVHTDDYELSQEPGTA